MQTACSHKQTTGRTVQPLASKQGKASGETGRRGLANQLKAFPRVQQQIKGVNSALAADRVVGKLPCAMLQTWHGAFRQLRAGEVLTHWVQRGGTRSAGEGEKHQEENVLLAHFKQAWAKHRRAYNKDQSCIAQEGGRACQSPASLCLLSISSSQRTTPPACFIISMSQPSRHQASKALIWQVWLLQSKN